VSTRDEDEIRRREAERCAALLARDEAALRDVVAADTVHIHGNGLVQRGDEYFRHAMASAYRRTDRGELHVDVDGDAALVTGEVITTIRDREGDPERVIRGVALQAWRRRDGAWRQVAFTLTPTPR
jgi:ketosteroid isomerase-like protein